MKKIHIITLLAAAGLPLVVACTTSIASTPAVAAAIWDPPTATPLMSESGPSNEYTTLNEEELAHRIVEAVIRVEEQTKILFSSTILIVTDESLTEEETRQALAIIRAAKDEIAAVEEAIQAYRDRYGQLAPETRDLLIAIEEDLDEIDALIDELMTSQEIDFAAVLDMVEKLDAMLRDTDLTASVERWQARVLNQTNEREALYLSAQPQAGKVANNRVDAFAQAHNFVDAFQEALNDETFSPDELSVVSQLAANARASLYNTGDPSLFDFAETIERLVRNAARGEWTLARSGIDTLWRSLPARPQP